MIKGDVIEDVKLKSLPDAVTGSLIALDSIYLPMLDHTRRQVRKIKLRDAPTRKAEPVIPHNRSFLSSCCEYVYSA